MTKYSNIFDGDKPVTFTQARKGEVICTQGHGNAPRVWRPSTNDFNPSGMLPPDEAPIVTCWNRLNQCIDDMGPQEVNDYYDNITYYVARIDINNPGAGLTQPPGVTVEEPDPIENESWPEFLRIYRAEAVSRIADKKLQRIEVTTHGRQYSRPPIVTLTEFVVDDQNGGGYGAKLKINTTYVQNELGGGGYKILNVEVEEPGQGYSDGNSIDFEPTDEGYGLPPTFFCIEKYTPGMEDAEVAGQFNVKVENGRVLAVEPDEELAERKDLERVISWQQQRSIIDPDTGSDYGEAQAIPRATLRGKYQCYYRYINDTIPEDEGGPLYSNLSPLTEVDTKYGASYLKWIIPEPALWEGRKIELWRSSTDQATTLFHVTTIEEDDEDGPFLKRHQNNGLEIWYIDDMHDYELTDGKRDDFMALPILLPNGELNANRFGQMSTDFAVAVMFQDRLWYSVDTTNKRPNSIMFSETDEPESCPDINELVIQQNLRSADYITALIPYAGALIVCQSRHSHRITYVASPLDDATSFLLAYRGAVSQRCWDLYEGILYVMDEFGVYSLDLQGKVEPLTVGIDDVFSDLIDWSKKKWFIVRADRKLNVLRCAVCYKGDAGEYPTRQICYSLDYKAWWVEVYPTVNVASTDFRAKDGTIERMWGSGTKKAYLLGETLTDEADGAITSVTITNPGRGYSQPPVITAPGGSCAAFTCSIDADGQVNGIQIRQCGVGYSNGSLQIEAPDSGEQATATYAVSNGTVPIWYSLLTGNMEFTTETQDPKAQTAFNRQVSVVYHPTENSSVLNLETYYNGAQYPRSNIITRDRGTGFIHAEDIPAAILDMKADQAQRSEAHGVARALFAGRTLDDMAGTDRHLAIGLSGKQDDAGKVTIHSVDVYGVNQES